MRCIEPESAVFHSIWGHQGQMYTKWRAYIYIYIYLSLSLSLPSVSIDSRHCTSNLAPNAVVTVECPCMLEKPGPQLEPALRSGTTALVNSFPENCFSSCWRLLSPAKISSLNLGKEGFFQGIARQFRNQLKIFTHRPRKYYLINSTNI